VSVEVGKGNFCLHQTFHVAASHAKGLLGKASSAEFAPDPALDPLWISAFEPFHGAIKKDFGLQVSLDVSPVEEPDKKEEPKKEAPEKK
jgi:hypothetical protein